MDTLIGNVILTGVLVVALIIFVVSAVGVAQFYSLQLDRTLLEREAVYVTQSVQQLYLSVNSSQGYALGQSVVLDLPMPQSLNNHAYMLSIVASPLAGSDETNLSAIVTLSGYNLQAGSSVVIGRCEVTSAALLLFYPTLKVNLTLSVAGSQEQCTIKFG
ncbi:MAG: hypothetical protein QW453_00190 [Thermoprotei archaeon]